MKNPDGFTREIRFNRIGLHTTNIEPLTVHGTDRIDLTGAVARYAARYLAPTTRIRIKAHPDDPQGLIYELAIQGNRDVQDRLLGTFTVALPETETSQ